MSPASVRYPSRYPPRDPFRRAGIVSWSILGVLLLAGIVVWLLTLVRDIFPPMALALIIIVLLNPMVSALERRGIRRLFGTTAIYLLFIFAITLAISYLAPPLGRQVNGLVERWPEIRQDALEVGEGLAKKVGLSLDELGVTNPESNPEPSRPGSRAAPEVSGGGGGEGSSFVQTLGARLFAGASRFATGALHVVLNFILAPVLALYLLIDLPKIQKAFLHYLPPRYRGEWLPLLERAGKAVGAFFRGQLLVAAIVGVLSSLGLLLIDLPYWLPLGLLVGFFNIIPLVGPFVGGAIAVVVGGVTGGVGLAVKAGLTMLAVQQIDNHFISPKVMGRAVRLHPVAVMLALLAGATLGGIWGMLLAVPGLGVAKIVAVHFYETRVLGNPDYDLPIGREDPAPKADTVESGPPTEPADDLRGPPPTEPADDLPKQSEGPAEPVEPEPAAKRPAPLDGSSSKAQVEVSSPPPETVSSDGAEEEALKEAAPPTRNV
jgi:predicted PurR-regulated permease PerM